jgi:mono/diheme cytochrome c family protein
MKPLIAAVILAVVVVAGCGGSSEDTASQSTPPAHEETAANSSNKGVGPITEVDVTTLDPEQAAAGAAIFEAKCTACHKIEERYIGPALSGVTKRREPEWIMNMILNPEVMVKEDETAKSLLAQYLAPMTNQHLTEDEARLVLTYFLENDKSIVE